MAFEVFVDVNFDFDDESARYQLGAFDSRDEAIALCQRIVDRDLNHEWQPGMTADQLYDRYTSFGQEPFIRDYLPAPNSPTQVPFSARTYAQRRSGEICARTSEQPAMSYTIVSDVCEGIADCIPVCPAECISWGNGRNAKGTKFVFIDDRACTNCGACLSVCPIGGAILDEWKPELQNEQ